jgi:4-hydroxybenzoate polyprenyltransferase
VFTKIKIIFQMIKFEHTVFALPFAFTAAILAAGGIPTGFQIIWIALAMVGARSGAMGMNRMLDADIDAKNPRTATRAIPAGLLTKAQVGIFSLLSFALLVLAAYKLNPLCFKLSPLAIGVVIFYSFTKRFTWAAHLFLGAALAFAPIGAWAAIRGTLELPAFVLAATIALWSAGFDVCYALQDMEFDKKMRLHSIPSYFGVAKSLWISRLLHASSVAGLIYLGSLMGLNYVYYIGVLAVAGMLLYEHFLLRGGNLSRIDAAFLNMNGYISVTVFTFTSFALWSA